MHSGFDGFACVNTIGEARPSLVQLVRCSCALLAIESERDLAYIYGRQPGNLDIPQRYRKGFRFSTAGRILSFFAKITSMVGVSRGLGSTDFLFFAGSDNQCKSLAPTLSSLDAAGGRVHMLAGNGVRERAIGDLRSWSRTRLAPRIIACAAGVFLARLSTMRTELLDLPARRYLDQFFWSYVHLPYFLDVLSKVRPRFVVMSNDHGVANRALRLAAESLGIRTVYLQHGAVSGVFPRMNYDIAFLDGMVSAEVYSSCRHNPPANGASDRTRAYLSGQKKRFPIGRVGRTSSLVVGVGVNPLDHFGEVTELVGVVASLGMHCVVRCHPAQSARFVSDLAAATAHHGASVDISDAKVDPLDGFLARCHILVAANTSLHLEAALAGIPSFYLEFGPTGSPDYYGFVARGVARRMPGDWMRMDREAWANLAEVPQGRAEALVAFSESHGTVWEGREGDLVAGTLLEMAAGTYECSSFEEVAALPGFSHVYRLRR